MDNTLEALILRIRLMLTVGLDRDGIHEQLQGQHDEGTIFLAYVAATMVQEDDAPRY